MLKIICNIFKYFTFLISTLKVTKTLINKITVFADNSNKEVVIKNNNNQTIKRVELYNLLGQKVKEWKNLETKFESRLQINNLPASVYIVKVLSDKGNISKKILID